jgi:tetratricopeptide (TPR) repeat protein
MDALTVPNLNQFIDIFDKYRNYIISIGVVIAATVGIGVYLYYSHINYEQAAQQALSEVLAEYNHAYESPDLWQDVEIGAKTGYRQYARSSLAVFFLNLQADALLQQDKNEEALILMNEMVSKLPQHSPFYYIYHIKLARMQLYSDQENMQKEGLEKLQILAKDENNPQRDEALYYLGQYYDENNQKEKMQEIWQQLKQIQRVYKEKDIISPWAMLAEQGK